MTGRRNRAQPVALGRYPTWNHQKHPLCFPTKKVQSVTASAPGWSAPPRTDHADVQRASSVHSLLPGESDRLPPEPGWSPALPAVPRVGARKRRVHVSARGRARGSCPAATQTPSPAPLHRHPGPRHATCRCLPPRRSLCSEGGGRLATRCHGRQQGQDTRPRGRPSEPPTPKLSAPLAAADLAALEPLAARGWGRSGPSAIPGLGPARQPRCRPAADTRVAQDSWDSTKKQRFEFRRQRGKGISMEQLPLCGCFHLARGQVFSSPSC